MVNPLARVIMEKNLKTEKVISSRTVNQRVTTEGNNLDDKEEKTISSIINGERKVIEGINKNTAITLEEAANRMKNNR